MLFVDNLKPREQTPRSAPLAPFLFGHVCLSKFHGVENSFFSSLGNSEACLSPGERQRWAVHRPTIRTCAPGHRYTLTIRDISQPEEQAAHTRQRSGSKDDRRARANPQNLPWLVGWHLVLPTTRKSFDGAAAQLRGCLFHRLAAGIPSGLST